MKTRHRLGYLFVLHAALAATPAFAQVKLHHVHISAQTPPDVAAWHQKLFGGQVMQFPPGPAVATPSGLVMTQKAAAGTPEGSARSVIGHVAFAMPNLDRELKRARDLGAKVVAPIQKRDGQVSAIIEDPWGVQIELIDAAARASADHVHLYVRDVLALQSWLVSVMGASAPALGNRQQATVELTDSRLVITRAGDRTQSAGKALDHIALQVRDLEATLAAVKQSGFQAGAIRPGAAGSRLAFVEGPEGIAIEVMQLPAN